MACSFVVRNGAGYGRETVSQHGFLELQEGHRGPLVPDP